MKKNYVFGVLIAAIALVFTACGGSSRMAKSTSTRVDLATSVRFIPSIANLEVQPSHVTATLHASDLESLKAEEMKQTLVAKALATVNGDLMLAPRFTTEKGADGKMVSMTVTGYAAFITSFRPMTEADVYEEVGKDLAQNHPTDKLALNTMTVADVEYTTKKTITLSPADLVGKNEETALKLAKERMLRQEKMDVLYGVQYSMKNENGSLTSFTMTAFPGKYVNYRQTTLLEQKLLQPGTKPVVKFKTIAADIQPVSARVQKKYGTNNAQAKESELKETARNTVLTQNKADFLLNETFYFDRAEKVITHVTICGTPAIYANFRPLKADEVVDVKLVPIAGDEQEKPKSFFDIFKKK